MEKENFKEKEIAKESLRNKLKELSVLRENKSDRNEINKKIQEVYSCFKNLLTIDSWNASLTPDEFISTKEIMREKMILRKEDPLRLFDCFLNDAPLKFTNKETKYANSVIWDPSRGSRGFDLCVMEGLSTLEGFETVIGFKEKDYQEIVSMVPEREENFSFSDRSIVRAIEGEIPLKDLNFIMVRSPAELMPEGELTEKEQERLDEYETDLILGRVKRDDKPEFPRIFVPEGKK